MFVLIVSLDSITAGGNYSIRLLPSQQMLRSSKRLKFPKKLVTLWLRLETWWLSPVWRIILCKTAPCRHRSDHALAMGTLNSVQNRQQKAVGRFICDLQLAHVSQDRTIVQNNSKKLEGERLVNRGESMAKNEEKRGAKEKEEYRGREWGERLFGHSSR